MRGSSRGEKRESAARSGGLVGRYRGHHEPSSSSVRDRAALAQADRLHRLGLLIALVAVVVTGCLWLRADPGPLDRFDASITDAVISVRTGWLDTFAEKAHTVGSRVGFAALGLLLVFTAAWFHRWRHLVIWISRSASPEPSCKGSSSSRSGRGRSGATARELGRLCHSVEPDRRDRVPLDRRGVHARRPRPAAVLGEDRGGGRDRDHRGAADLPGRRPLHRRRVRRDRRGCDRASWVRAFAGTTSSR